MLQTLCVPAVKELILLLNLKGSRDNFISIEAGYSNFWKYNKESFQVDILVYAALCAFLLGKWSVTF